jgi:hypothetical protein
MDIPATGTDALQSESTGGMMAKDFTEKAPDVPTDERALRRLRRHVEDGDLEDLGQRALPQVPRYLVTYMRSQTGTPIRSATIVTVTNQAIAPNLVTVSWFAGFSDNTVPVGVSSLRIPADFTQNFGSRNLPSQLTHVNSWPNPQLIYTEGRAIVSAGLPEIGVSARVYYTSGDQDEELLAITDSKVVVFSEGNLGD